MDLLSSKNIVNHVENIVHEDTQLHTNCIDLTVASVHWLTEAGALDFGGSEFEPAQTKQIEPEKENPDDDYGWWKLNAGRYKAVFNENFSASEDTVALIAPHNHSREAGVVANTQILSAEESSGLIFDVPAVGCNIKENARFATLYLLKS